MERLTKVFILVACALLATACTEDLDFDVNNRSLDVTTETSEQVVLGVMKATFLALNQGRLNDFLDASQLPVGAVENGGIYTSACVSGGTADYTFSRPAGEEHRAGDRVSVNYAQCKPSPEITLNGELSVKYSALEGLNKRFISANSEQCLARLSDDLGGQPTVLENIDENGEFFWADDVFIVREGSQARLDYVELTAGELESDSPTYTVLQSHFLGANEDVIAIVRRLELDPDRSSPNETFYRRVIGPLPSLDGDLFYTMDDRRRVTEACQGFRRTLLVSFSDYSVRNDTFDMEFFWHGRLKLDEATDNPLERVVIAIDDSSYTLDVRQGAGVEAYKLLAVDIAFTEDRMENSYVFTLDGELSSDAIKGRVEVSSAQTMYGEFDTLFPQSGLLSILGRDLEHINVLPDGELIRIDVNHDGDNNGDNIPEVDFQFNTFWQNLFNQDFVEAE